MGNAELKNAFKNSLKDASQSAEKLGLTPEVLLEDQLIAHVKKFVIEKMGVIDIDKAKAFPESSHQVNENEEENFKRQFIAELNDTFITGFPSAQSNLQLLQDPAFERFFTVSSSSDSAKYASLQHDKLIILYALFVEKYKDRNDKTLNFFDYIRQFLAKTDASDRVQAGLEAGLKFSITLMREIQGISKEMLVNALEYMHQTLRNIEPGSLYSTDKLSFMIDANMNDARAFLVSVIENNSNPERAIELSFKIIFLIGIARSNIEDLLIVATLMDKQQPNFDLRQELAMLKDESHSSSAKPEGTAADLGKTVIVKRGRIFLFSETQLNEAAVTATDGQYLYVFSDSHQEGLMKFGTGQQGQMLGKLYQQAKTPRDSSTSMVYLNGKLLLRSEHFKPFAVFNPQTLEEEKFETAFNKDELTLEWKEDAETGRHLTSTPMFTDGTYLYVVSLRHPKRQEEEKHDPEDSDVIASQQKPTITVEVYDPSTNAFAFVREIPLYKDSSHKIFTIDENKIHQIHYASFATNGQIIRVSPSGKNKSYYFDAKTGILIQKVKEGREISENLFSQCYDYEHNAFFSVDLCSNECYMTKFIVKNFKRSGASSGFEKEFQSPRLAKFQSLLYDEEYEQRNLESPAHLNLIERIMLNVSTPLLIQDSRKRDEGFKGVQSYAKIIKTLILSHCDKSSSTLQKKIEDIKSQNKTVKDLEKHLLTCFKYPYSTYLTSTLFNMMQVNLNRSLVIIKEKKTSQNLHDQYSFYFLLKILKSNFDALNVCGLSLSDIIKQKDAYSDFLDAYRSSVVRIVEKGFNPEFEGNEAEEMKSLWQLIYQLCIDILSSSVNMNYADTKDILVNLTKNVSQITNEKQAENCSISLNYLSQQESTKNIIDLCSTELDLIKTLACQCCDLLAKAKVKLIQSVDIQESRGYSETQDSISNASNKLIKSLSEQAITAYCSLSESVASKQGQLYKESESDKAKLRCLEQLICHFFEQFAFKAKEVLDTAAAQLSAFFEGQSADIATLYGKFADFIDQDVQHNICFMAVIQLYIQTFSLFKPKMQILSTLIRSTTFLLASVSGYLKVVKANAERLSDVKDDMKVFLEGCVKSLAWFEGMTAYKLMKVKEDPVDADKDKKPPKDSQYDMIIQSNLLAGGLQTRFLNFFSGESQTQLSELIKITQEKNLLANAQKSANDSEEDKTLAAIMHKNNDPLVDRVMNYLQQYLERKIPMVPYARLSGEDGFRLSRAAFAVMVFFSSEGVDKFQEMVDEIDMKWTELENDEEREFKIKDFIKTNKAFEAILKRWENASKMRQWVMEKKKNLAEKVKKQVETTYRKEKEAKQADQKDGQNKEQIDTTLADDESAAVDELADKKYNQELALIYDKIVEKAEFLLKLNVPESFKIKDTLSSKVGGLLFIRNIQSMENVESQIGGGVSDFTWRERLKNWKQMQTSKGVIKSFTDKNKEIFESSVMSILACLQTPISSQKIKKQVETVFLNATKRIAGLQIIKDLISLELPSNVRLDIISWFVSSIRGNKNLLCHYLDDIKGCGESLEDFAREKFFSIIRSLVGILKDSQDESEIKALISALKWKFTARDHGQLRSLDLFKVLHEGNGAKNNPLKMAWGKTLDRKVISSENERQLQKDILGLFEQMFLITVGRIVSDKSAENIKLKQSGTTSVPSLMKAQSFVDENMSEYLVAQSFEVIFKELARYVKMVREFKGIDWQNYVKIMNKAVKEGGNAHNPHRDHSVLDMETTQEEDKSDLVSDEMGETEGTMVQKHVNKLAEKEFKQIHQLYQETFLNRLLRLVDIFTSVAQSNPYPMHMVQRVATPYQIEILLEIMIQGPPRLKIASLKIIENLIKLQLPFEVFEETIKIITREKESLPGQILNDTVPQILVNGSIFIQFLFNYVISVRHHLWSDSSIESTGSYAVTQEVISLFKSIYEGAPQQEFQLAIRNKIRSFLQTDPKTWNIEESDLVLSILPAGSFARLMIGSCALYKETQRCIVLGFSDKVKQEQDLGVLENNVLGEIMQSFYCDLPDQQLALVLFVGDNSTTFIPEVRAMDIASLCPVPTSYESAQKSILYEAEIVRAVIKILEIDTDENSSLALKQAQIQLLKIITFLVENEARLNGHSDFLNMLVETNLAKDLFSFLQRNANKPEISSKAAETKLPNELLELQLTSLRTKVLESKLTLFTNHGLKACLSENDTLTFFQQRPKDEDGVQAFLKTVPVAASINEHVLSGKLRQLPFQVVFLGDVRRDSSLLRFPIEILVIESSDLLQHEDLVLQYALQKANIIISNESLEPEQIYLILRQINAKINKPVSPIHMKPVFIIAQSDLEAVIQRKIFGFTKYEGRLQQIDQFVEDLKTWGGFTQEQATKIQTQEKTDDPVVTDVQRSMGKIMPKIQDEGTETNVKKLLVGKMASLGRRQNSVHNESAIFDDIGEKIWHESFESVAITALMEKISNQEMPPKKTDEAIKDRKGAYIQALTAKVVDDKGAQQRYNTILNKLIRLKSRTSLLTFLNYIDPLPVDILNSITSLDKLLLLAFNEAVHMKNLTGDTEFLNQVKHLLERIMKEPGMREFVGDFLANQLIKPSQTIIKRILENKEFLAKNVFESEVDAQMLPLPQFISAVVQLALAHCPDLFDNIRGFLPNVVSIFVAIFLAKMEKSPASIRKFVKLLYKATKLLTYVRTHITQYRFVEDVANMKFFMKLMEANTNAKLSGLKTREHVKAFAELYYEWTQVRVLFCSLGQSAKVAAFLPKAQTFKFQRKVNYLKTQDGLLHFKLCDESGGSVSKVREALGRLSKKLATHPGEYRVPFIARIKALEGAEALSAGLSISNGLQSDDKMKFFADKEGRRLLASVTANQEAFYTDKVFLAYEHSRARQFYYFGQTRRGRLNNNVSGDGMKDPETYPGFDENVTMVSSCKNGSIFLDHKGYIRHCGTIAGMSLSGNYETRDWTQFKLVTSGKRNLAAVSKDNAVFFYGGSKNNHYTTSTHETSNWYKVGFKDALAKDEQIIDISSGNHFTALVTSAGNLYGVGDYILSAVNKAPHAGEAKFTKLNMLDHYKALRVWASRAKYCQAIIVSIENMQTQERYLVSIGQHMSSLLGTNTDENLEFKTLDYDYQRIQFDKVSLLTNHALAVTKNGELYGWGANVNRKLGFPEDTVLVSKPTLVPYFSDKKRFRVIDVACGDEHSFVHVEEFDDFGGSLGLRLFQLGFNPDESEHNYRGATKEQLYEGLGIVRLTQFDNLSIQAMAAGHNTSFVFPVSAPIGPKDSWVTHHVKNEVGPSIFKKGYIHFYFNKDQPIKDNLPLDADEEEVHKDNIDDLEVQSTTKASALAQEEESKDGSPSKADEERARLNKIQLIEEKKHARERKRKARELRKQEILGKDPARQGWHFLSHAELPERRDLLPAVSISLRHPVKNLYLQMDYFKELLDQAQAVVQEHRDTRFSEISDHGVTCSETGKPIEGTARYYASYMVQDGLKEIHLSEQAFDEPTEFDILSLIYFRLTHPLKEGQSLPVVDLSRLFVSEGDFSFEVEVQAPKVGFGNRQQVVALFKEQEQDVFKKCFLSLLKNSDTGFEKQVMQSFADVNENRSPNFERDFWDKKKEVLRFLKDGKSDDLSEDFKYMLAGLRKLVTEDNFGQVHLALFKNAFFQKVAKKILARISERPLKNCLPDSLPHLRKTIIANLPGYMKQDIMREQIANLPTYQRYEVTVRRRKAQAFIDSGACDHEGINTIFGQIMQSLKKDPDSRKCFKQNSVDSQIFRVEFKGEGSIDAGGPYRETLTNICNELQSAALPLLIPTPNNKNNHGQFRECWMVNPSSISPAHLEMFTYFGHFIGAAIRSEQALPLDLAPIFWKLLIDETDLESDTEREMDLKAFDTYSWQVIQDLMNNTKDLSDEDFDAVIDEYFVTLLSNGKEIELMPGGRNVKVTKKNLDEYIRLVVNTRINESQKQMKAIKDGVDYVLSLNIVRFLNATQIEARATGSKTLDIAKLKQITVYEGASSTDPHIQIFWDVLESFNDQEKSLYLKFVWGRARLPSTTSQNHKLVTMTYTANACLPVSHTCFFTLDYPRYPNFEIARERILFAIRFCGDIDADRSAYDIGSDD